VFVLVILRIDLLWFAEVIIILHWVKKLKMEKKCSSVIVMSPLLQSADRNIIRVQRLDHNHLPEKYVLLVAGGLFAE